MGEVERGNERRRSMAMHADAPIYSHEVIEAWPACVDCGLPIRRPLGEAALASLRADGVRAIGMWRGCGCSGVAWRAHPTGGTPAWERFSTRTTSSDPRHL